MSEDDQQQISTASEWRANETRWPGLRESVILL